MKTKIYPVLILIAFVAIPLSCEKIDPNKPDLSTEVLVLNNWILEGLSDAYLWEDYMPEMDPEYQEDPEKFFYDLLFNEDKYSWIVDDYEELTDMFKGVSLSTGMSVRRGILGETQVIGIVEYVTPESPASEADIKRGDIIITIDGKDLDAVNYYDLYYQTTASFEFADWDGSQLVSNGKSISLTAIELDQNPVIHHEIIEYEGKKVGYLVYTQFTAGEDNKWKNELKAVFQEFKSGGISEMVLDLRYNPGGSLDLSAYIASTIGPKAMMENEDVYVNLVWNDGYNEYWKKQDLDKDGKADGEDSYQLVIKMPESDFNLDLSTIYFLTTDGTASASESLMTGLYPYLDVVQIGTTSYGKCYGSVTIDDWYPTKRHNWAMQPIVLKYSNSEGFTDFVSGIDPDFLVEDKLLYAEPFGSLKDPLLAKALEEISGIYPAGKKSSKMFTDAFKSLPAPPNKMIERNIKLPKK